MLALKARAKRLHASCFCTRLMLLAVLAYTGAQQWSAWPSRLCNNSCAHADAAKTTADALALTASMECAELTAPAASETHVLPSSAAIACEGGQIDDNDLVEQGSHADHTARATSENDQEQVEVTSCHMVAVQFKQLLFEAQMTSLSAQSWLQNQRSSECSGTSVHWVLLCHAVDSLRPQCNHHLALCDAFMLLSGTACGCVWCNHAAFHKQPTTTLATAYNNLHPEQKNQVCHSWTLMCSLSHALRYHICTNVSQS